MKLLQQIVNRHRVGILPPSALWESSFVAMLNSFPKMNMLPCASALHGVVDDVAGGGEHWAGGKSNRA